MEVAIQVLLLVALSVKTPTRTPTRTPTMPMTVLMRLNAIPTVTPERPCPDVKTTPVEVGRSNDA